MSQPIQQPACDGKYIVVLGSAITPGSYREEVQGFLDANRGSHYLHAPSTGCGSLRQQVNGADVYVVFAGPFTGPAACAVRNEVGGDAYVKPLDNVTPSGTVIAC